MSQTRDLWVNTVQRPNLQLPSGIKRFNLPERSNNCMTVVAAMSFPDFLLFASDSQETIEHLTQPVAKVLTHADPPLAWAISGELGVGQDLARWVRGFDWQPTTSWVEFRRAAKAELTRLNKLKRESIRASGSKPNKDDTACVLFAGYIKHEPEILEISDRGETYFWQERGFGAIGSGHNHARMAKYTLEAYHQMLEKPLTHTPQTFGLIVELAARLDIKSAPPTRLYKVSHDGVAAVSFQNAGSTPNSKTD